MRDLANCDGNMALAQAQDLGDFGETKSLLRSYPSDANEIALIYSRRSPERLSWAGRDPIQLNPKVRTRSLPRGCNILRFYCYKKAVIMGHITTYNFHQNRSSFQ